MKAVLTDLTIRNLKPGVYFDQKTPAFGIRVGKLRKTWLVVRGKTRTQTVIGHYPAMSLAEARTEAKKLSLTPPAKAVTVAEARTAYLASHQGRETTTRELTRILTKHFPDGELGKVKLPIGLPPSELLHAFRAMRAMLRWCVRPPHRYLEHSPFEGMVAPGRDGQGTRILSDSEVKTLLAANRGQCGAATTLMLLWGTRRGETLALRKDWIVDGVLTIPGHVTKNGRPHTIPILPFAQSIIDTLPSPYLFPGKEGALQVRSWGRMHATFLKRTGTSGWSAHSCRRTFRTVCARHGVSRDLAERLLNHAQGALDVIYDHHDYLEAKREALAKIESWLTSLLPSPSPD